jgi:hypothetical protein
MDERQRSQIWLYFYERVVMTSEDNFVETGVLPPGIVIKRPCVCDGRMGFTYALALAICMEERGEPLLEALRKKWPEAVESSIGEARRRVQEAVSASIA